MAQTQCFRADGCNATVFDVVVLNNAQRMRILPYIPKPAEFRAYDSQVAEVAHLLVNAIQHEDPQLQVEHVGSTSVPNCGGKGVIDLAVLYREGFLAPARAVLDRLGFQKQTGPEPFPESRPMRVGAVEHDG